ncbi:expressed unknown protein [Seminavis robusta]|uniref:Uncharacterized protein n=1 Tax=Seminavis robusta TaxID=568900 RepID=A0A9N8ETM9_9STRA|nr:expressed unknown protein [Seminavis robusta]|eukprot:Sro1932_g306200.1 n/a (150) ;mRNA; r:16471-16920
MSNLLPLLSNLGRKDQLKTKDVMIDATNMTARSGKSRISGSSGARFGRSKTTPVEPSSRRAVRHAGAGAASGGDNEKLRRTGTSASTGSSRSRVKRSDRTGTVRSGTTSNQKVRRSKSTGQDDQQVAVAPVGIRRLGTGCIKQPAPTAA